MSEISARDALSAATASSGYLRHPRQSLMKKLARQRQAFDLSAGSWTIKSSTLPIISNTIRYLATGLLIHVLQARHNLSITTLGQHARP
jgi:hypothetical protein